MSTTTKEDKIKKIKDVIMGIKYYELCFDCMTKE
jgi:hypothetical protein